MTNVLVRFQTHAMLNWYLRGTCSLVPYVYWCSIKTIVETGYQTTCVGVISLTIGHHQRDFRIPFQQLLRNIMAQTQPHSMPVHANLGKGNKRWAIAWYVQNMEPVQICTGFIFCTSPAIVTPNLSKSIYYRYCQPSIRESADIVNICRKTRIWQETRMY